MKHTLEITLDRNYYSETYSQLVRYGSKWRKFERIAGPFLLVTGFLFLILTDKPLISSFVLMLIGIYEILSPTIKKPFWIARLMKGKLVNNVAELTLTDEGIESKTQFTQNTIKWEALERILETPKGLLIWPQKGMCIYIPKSVTKKETIKFIMENSYNI